MSDHERSSNRLLSFLQSRVFEDAWVALGLNDDDMIALEIMVGRNPEIGDVVAGTAGLRKVRFAP